MEDQPTTKSLQAGQPQKQGWRFWLKAIAGLIIFLTILYFVSEDLFISLTAKIFAVGAPILSVVFVASPFLYIKRKKLKLDFYNIAAASLVSAFFILLIIKAWEVLLIFMFKLIGTGFLGTF